MPLLHIANGTSTTRLIEAAGIPGVRSIWADPLYEGPVPHGLEDEALRRVRADYLSGSTGLGPDEVMNDLARWRRAIEGCDATDEIVLWFEHDLFDQLNLVQLLDWIHVRFRASQPAESGLPAIGLICIGSFAGRPHFKGLGELTATEIASLLPTRERVSDAQFDLAQRAWAAFRGPTPEALDRLRQSDSELSALPFLARALERFLQEYPWTRDGLSRSERTLLELASDGPIEVRAMFPRMHDREDAYYITDLSLAALTDDLSRTSPPLVARGDAPGHGRNGSLQETVEITEAGRAILAGRLDRVKACGLDRWLGGVHLAGTRVDWRWDEEQRGIVPAMPRG